MSTTLFEARTDYSEGTGPGDGSVLSAADLLRVRRGLDLYARALSAGFGAGIYPYPSAGSFQVSISSGLIAAVAAGYGAALVAARGHVPMIEPGTTVTLPASKTGWYLFANVDTSGGLSTADSRDTGAVTYATAASNVPADGQVLLAQFTTSGSAITSVTDLRTFAGNAGDGSGQLTKDVTGSSDVTLTATEARAGNLNFTGVLGASINVIVPTTPRLWLVANNTTGAFTLTVKTASGTGVAVPQGTQVLLTSDGTNVVGPTFAGAQVETMGTGAGTMTLSGSASTQTSSSGIGNAADTTDDTLFTYSLPLNSLSSNGKGIRVVAGGKTAANGNDKRVKLWFAGTAVVDSGVITSNAKNWQAEATVTRIDSTHVSCVGTFRVDGGTTQVVGVTANLSVSDLTSNASIVKTTGSSPTTGAASDVLGYQQKVWMDN